jgi:hypothetical protein
MRKNYMVLLATILITAGSFAQKGTTFIGAGGDLVLPSGVSADYFKTGMGFYAKGLFGVGTAGQITVTSGYAGFKTTIPTDIASSSGRLIPLLLGYRHNFNGFFVEPQVGYSILGITVSDGGDYYTNSDGGFTWAAGIGYVFNNKVEVSGRYQASSKGGETDAFFGLRLGYNFSLNGPKKQ